MKNFLIPEERIRHNYFSAFNLAIGLNMVSFFRDYFSDSFIGSGLGGFSVRFSGYFSLMHKLVPITKSTERLLLAASGGR